MTDCVTSGVLSYVHKSRSVVKCFLVSTGPVQELSLSQPLRESAACCRIHSYFIRWCRSPGYFAPCPLGKFSQELKFVPRICALSAVRDLLIGNLRVLWKAVRYRVRHIW